MEKKEIRNISQATAEVIQMFKEFYSGDNILFPDDFEDKIKAHTIAQLNMLYRNLPPMLRFWYFKSLPFKGFMTRNYRITRAYPQDEDVTQYSLRYKETVLDTVAVSVEEPSLVRICPIDRIEVTIAIGVHSF